MDRNTEHLHRERAARDEALLERATRAPRGTEPPRSPGAYPNAADDHHHVVLTHAQVPGLGASSPDDGGLRKYPSWDDNIGDPDAIAGPGLAPPGMATAATARAGALDELAAEDAYAAALEEEAARRAIDDELEGAYHAAETASPGMMARVAAPEDFPRPGAFPGHLPDAGRDGPRLARRPPRKSFAMSGADPVEYAFDPRAAAEAAAAEAKRSAFRAELDEQMRVKREMDDARRSGNRPRRRAPEGGTSGGGPKALAAEENTYYDPGWGADLVAMGRAGVGDHVIHRDVMHGVPRRGVTSIDDDYASPQRRAGGGPSSFYLGGDAFSDASLARGGDGVSFDPLRASPGANQMSQAELARRQLVADLDEQVRQKREEKRLRELREELEDAKVERRIQEVIEQERREREMKERLLIEEGGAKGGDGNVGNSPRARLEDDRDEDDRGEDDRGEGAGEGAAKPISAASLPDDHDALTPQRQLVRSPDVAARRPPADVHREDAHARRLGFGDGAETEPGAGAAALSVAEGKPSTPSSAFRAPSDTPHRASTPLDRKIARLQAQLEARDAELDAAKEEAARAARERDLAERERDLEQQLHRIRDEMAAAGRVGVAASRVAALDLDRDIVDNLGDGHAAAFAANGAHRADGVRRSFKGTDISSFVVDSGFVRVDAPIGGERSRDELDHELVPKGYTVRPEELQNKVPGRGAPRVAGLQRRQARVMEEERRRAGKHADRDAGARRMKENRDAAAARPAWGANRPKRPGNRWM